MCITHRFYVEHTSLRLWSIVDTLSWQVVHDYCEEKHAEHDVAELNKMHSRAMAEAAAEALRDAPVDEYDSRAAVIS
jgi:hypothetical protein